MAIWIANIVVTTFSNSASKLLLTQFTASSPELDEISKVTIATFIANSWQHLGVPEIALTKQS